MRKRYTIIDKTQQLKDYIKKDTKGFSINKKTKGKVVQYSIYSHGLKKDILFARTEQDIKGVGLRYGIKRYSESP